MFAITKLLRCLALLAFGLLAAWPILVTAKDFKGAELITRSEYKYGAVEARIRAARGSGMVTAFFYWKNDSELSYTEWQEQDFEIFGKDGTYQTQIMTPGDPRTENKVYHSLPGPAWESYYTYRMEWTPSYLAFYIDGRLVRIETSMTRFEKHLDPSRAEASQIRLSLWAGDRPWSGFFDADALTAATFVDYFEVFEFDEESDTFNSLWRDDFTGSSIDTSKWWFANWTFEYAVNDYVSRNAMVRDGKLILTLTDNESSGAYFGEVPENNPVVINEGNQEGLPPYTPVAVPSRVEAEVVSAYQDTDRVNSGDSECGAIGLDVELTGDILGGVCSIGWTQPGEWTKYIIEVADANEFLLALRLGTGRTSDVFVRVDINGVPLGSGLISVPRTSWSDFTDVTVPVELDEGAHTVRVTYVTGGVNFNYMDFSIAGEISDPPVVDIVAKTIPAIIEAEDYSRFYDTTVENQGDAVCGTSAGDAEVTNDGSGQCNIGWTAPGEWLEYALDVPQTGEYQLSLRVGTGSTTPTFVTISVGETSVATVEIPRTSWQTFSDLTLPINLATGEHNLRLTFDTGRLNLNWLEFSVVDEVGVTEPIEPTEPAEPAACNTPLVTYEAESMVHGVGGRQGSLWNLWSNGEITVSHSFEGGQTELTILAMGSLAGDDLPHMSVSVNGTTIGEADVGAELLPYSFVFEATPGPANVSIAFNNDYIGPEGDRNLLMDWLMIDECY